MPRRLAPVVALLGCLLVSGAARADYLVLELKAEAGGASKTAAGEELALGVAPKPRGVLTVKPGSRVTVRWTVRHAAAAGNVKNVLLHFVAVKQEQLGQRAAPKLGKDVVAESALTMDFQPRDESRGEQSFTTDRPGFYLLRLETVGAAVGAEGHEHFAALDLAVQ